MPDYVAGPGFGFDKKIIVMSLGHFVDFILLNLKTGLKEWYVMNQPTNEAWIDSLVTELKNVKLELTYNKQFKK